MNTTPAYKLLWVDDHIDKLDSYVDAIREEGFEVSTASGTEDALLLIQAHQYDVVLVDINMPPPDGIELLRRIQALKLPSKPVLGALSSFTYLQRYRTQLKQLAHPVELLDKDIPNVEAPEFRENFIHPIRDLAEHGVRFTIEVQEDALKQSSENDPFQISLPDFAKLSLLEKDQLLLKAEDMAKKVLEREFKEGNVWVLMCGSSTQVRAWAHTMDEILDEEAVMDFARAQNRAPFQFLSAVHVEDFDVAGPCWSQCDGHQYRTDYPTVTLEFDTQPLNLHFDTGSPISFFSYEKLREMEIIPETFGFSRGSRVGNNKGYMCVWRPVPAILICQTTGQTLNVTINCQVIRNWMEGPYARFCKDVTACNRNVQETRDPAVANLCVGRFALVGRNLIIDNQITLILDGANKTTSLPAPKD